MLCGPPTKRPGRFALSAPGCCAARRTAARRRRGLMSDVRMDFRMCATATCKIVRRCRFPNAAPRVRPEPGRAAALASGRRINARLRPRRPAASCGNASIRTTKERTRTRSFAPAGRAKTAASTGAGNLTGHGCCLRSPHTSARAGAATTATIWLIGRYSTARRRTPRTRPARFWRRRRWPDRRKSSAFLSPPARTRTGRCAGLTCIPATAPRIIIHSGATERAAAPATCTAFCMRFRSIWTVATGASPWPTTFCGISSAGWRSPASWMNSTDGTPWRPCERSPTRRFRRCWHSAAAQAGARRPTPFLTT